jgi:hypothetical protein
MRRQSRAVGKKSRIALAAGAVRVIPSNAVVPSGRPDPRLRLLPLGGYRHSTLPGGKAMRHEIVHVCSALGITHVPAAQSFAFAAGRFKSRIPCLE